MSLLIVELKWSLNLALYRMIKDNCHCCE